MTFEEWQQIEPEIVRVWMSGDSGGALRLIQSVLDRGDDESRARALVYRGSIREEEEDWAAAKDDFTQAAGLFKPGSYPRYTAELSVGLVCENAGELREGVEWYRAALMTCARADELFSGAAAIKALLALQPALAPPDLELARAVTTRSWKVLNLTGEPDLNDLARSAEILRQRASDPR